MSDELASQVAAGEVVERPASVVKELVENSIDAGARQISVLARRGGTALLRVVDDGSGMNREDAVLSLERHATSKLRTSDDLGAILTMGFRGEALPSIASVSRFTLQTREPGALSGTEVIVEGGKLVAVNDCGEAPGTQIEVRQLFSNLPARRKFLRSENTEFSHIEQQVRVLALAHPEIGFSLTRDERLLFHLPGGAGLLERIHGLAGEGVAHRLLEIPAQTAGPVRVWGYLGEPGLHRPNRALQFTFLNRRPVESPVFQYALRAGYGDALPRGQAPVVFLFLEIDPGEVDVNVHPAKREVRFRDGLGVQSALAEVIAATLRRGRGSLASGESPDVSAPAEAPPLVLRPPPRWTPPPVQPQLPELELPKPSPAADPPSVVRTSRPEPPPGISPDPRPDPAPAPQDTAEPLPTERPSPPAAPKPAPSSPPAPKAPAVPAFRILGPLGDDYSVMESDEGLVLLDHRAAWERVLYEEARDRAARREIASQALLAPLSVQLSPREFDFLRPQLPALRRMGLGIEEFGANTVLIDSLPAAWERDGAAADLLSALIDELRHAGDRAPLRRLDDDAIAAAVARQAARHQPARSAEATTALITRLFSCEMPYCCPAGRPTLVQISFQELARKFGRR